MVTHKDLSRVVSAYIDVVFLSDHAPVHMTLHLGPVTQSAPISGLDYCATEYLDGVFLHQS